MTRGDYADSYVKFHIDGETYDFYGEEIKWVLAIADHAATFDDAWEETKRFGDRIGRRRGES